MTKDWQPINTALRDITLVRLRGQLPKPFECVGHFVGVGWVAVKEGRIQGAVDPLEWAPLSGRALRE
jgi:hypothetical protein